MKKWTYLVAAALMTGATPVFTGCIDNDEPAGIEQLRGAKAELISAKAAVEAAKVAQIEADAAYKRAQAEYQLALAAVENANAKIKEAEAALKQQQLEADKAELEHQIAVWEQERQEALAAAERAAKEWELAYKQAEVEYEKALVELAQAKIGLAIEQQAALATFIAEVKYAKIQLDNATEEVRLAQKNVEKAAAAVEDTETNKEYWQYYLARTLKLEEYALEGIQAALDKANEELAEIPEEAEGLGLKHDELIAEQNEIRKQIADASVAAAEAKRVIMDGEYAEWVQKVNDMYDRASEEIEIPAFVYPEVTNEALPFSWWDEIVNDDYLNSRLEATSYSYLNSGNLQYRIYILTYLLERIEDWTRDDNDNAWTEQRIAEWKKQIEQLEKKIEDVTALWQQAVDAYYRTPADAVIDLTKIDGYSEVVAALPAFNAAVTDVQAKWQAFIDARDEADFISREQNAAYENAEEKYWNEDYQKAWDDANKIAEEEQKKKDELWQTYWDLQEDLNNGVEGVTSEQVDAAWKAYEEYEARNSWTIFDEETNPAAEKVRDEAKAAAVKAKNEGQAKIKEAIEAYNAARTELEAQYDVVKPLYEAFYQGVSPISYAFMTPDELDWACGIDYGYETLYTIYTYFDSNIYASTSEIVRYRHLWNTENYYTIPVEYLSENVTYATMRELISARSRILYGSLYVWSGLENEYGDPTARLLPLTPEEVQEMIYKDAGQAIYGEEYIKACYNYGAMGDIFAMEAQIAFAEAWIADDNASVKKLVDALTTAITALEDEYEALDEQFQAEVEALNDEYNAIDQKIEATTDGLAELRAKLEPIADVLSAINSAMAEYEEAGYDCWDAATIESQTDMLNKLIRGLELDYADQEHAIETAKRNLEKYNSEEISALEAAQEILTVAENQYNTAKEAYDAALDALYQMMEMIGMEVPADDTTAAE